MSPLFSQEALHPAYFLGRMFASDNQAGRGPPTFGAVRQYLLYA